MEIFDGICHERAPQDIPVISGYQLGFGCQCVKAYNNENPVINQKIL